MRDPAAIVLDRTARFLGLVGTLLMLGTVVLMVVKRIRAEVTVPPSTVVLGFACLLGMLGLAHLAARRQQSRNRIMAAQDGREYFLYLRSLQAKELQSVTHSGGGLNPSPNAFIIDDILEEVAEAVSGIGTLFVIGSKEAGSMVWSPTTILLRSSELSWRPLFARLAKGARAIIVIPGSTPGILEELTQIEEQGLLRKVLVVMPPATGRDSRRKIWNSVSSALQDGSRTLPQFREEGMIYTVSTGLAPRRALPFVIDGERNLGEALRTLIADMPPSESARDAIGDVEEIERGEARPAVAADAAAPST